MIVYRTLYLVFLYGVINWNSILSEQKKRMLRFVSWKYCEGRIVNFGFFIPFNLIQHKKDSIEIKFLYHSLVPVY
jgi:hypothetical protein